MKKIIIIGATGEIGVYVTDYFAKRFKNQYEIIAVGRKKTDVFSTIGVKYINVDIRKYSDFEALPSEDVHAVVYTAAVMPGRMEGYHPKQYLETNIMGTYNVLEYCRTTKVDRIIYTQTIRDVGKKIGKEIIYSDADRDYSLEGDHAFYVISKNASVDMIENYFLTYGIKRFIFRLPTVYLYSKDECYHVNGVKRVMGYRHMMNQALEGKDIEVWGDKTKAHDILYIKDLTELFALACENGTDGGVFNAGTGIPVSILEQVEGMVKVLSPENQKSKIIFCPEKTNARSYDIDISKAQQVLGYEPKYSYIDYLEDFKKEMQEKRFDDM